MPPGYQFSLINLFINRESAKARRSQDDWQIEESANLNDAMHKPKLLKNAKQILINPPMLQSTKFCRYCWTI